MAKETEIKLRIRDEKGFRRLLQRVGARPIAGGSSGVHEENVIFDTPQGGLAKNGQLLRIRTETPQGRTSGHPSKTTKQRVLITFKSPVKRKRGEANHEFSSLRQPDARQDGAQQHKVREEIEVEVSKAGAFTQIFEGLGMAGWFRYEKYRTTFKFPPSKTWARGLLIELDKTPIGTFVELEGPPEAIDRAAKELGFSKRDYVLKNYLSLYVEECRKKGIEPADMVFSANKTTPK